VFTSISLIILSSIGLSILTKKLFAINFSRKKNYPIKISYVVLIIFLFSLPLVFPTNYNWINSANSPPVILTGATSNPPVNDWLETMEWIKLNTPENSKIASWWDYGYWITTLSDRTTYVDNSTLSTKAIQNMATMLMSSTDDSWQILKEMDADYVLIFLSAEDIGSKSTEFPLYVQGGGGDESKIYWFSKIAGLNPANYVNSDNQTPTLNFYDNTMLGKMIPFSPVLYYQPQTEENSQFYKHGFVEISKKTIKFENETDPLKLVYTSPSFYNDNYRQQIFIVIYEVNKNYLP
jgi:dolichyl-diphosphooligosaccharide--protein glycosyltransferase